MKTWVIKLRHLAKKVIAYSIEGEEKVYRLKHTPFRVKRHYTRRYHRELEGLFVQPDKIVVDNYMGRGYGCNGKYVTQALLASGEALDIVWTVKDPAGQQEQFPKGVRLVRYGSPEALREYATAGIWLCNYHLMQYLHRGLLKKTEQTYIQMWHGSFGIKKIENDCRNLTEDKNWTFLAEKNSKFTDYWISNGRFETEIYRRAFWDVEHVLEYGHPRNDVFFHGRERQARSFVERYVGRTNEKFLLYVPTFRDDDTTQKQAPDLLRIRQSLTRRFGGNWTILVRMHPRMRESLITEELVQAGGVDVTGYPDIQELLAAADAVITDYSSAVFDFLLTGRPAFIYAPDYDDYQQMRGLYYPLWETPFPIASDNDGLAERILEFDEDAYRKRTEAFLEGKGSVEDGRAAERTAELILDKVRQNRERQRQGD